MQLLTEELKARLLANGRANAQRTDDNETDHIPVVKFFNPIGAATWLISEMIPDEPDILFGLCDLGFGEAEMGYVRLSELEGLRLPGGLTIERDLYFKGKKPLTEYWEEARKAGRIQA